MENQAVSRPAILSGLFGETIAEFFGTMILVLFGDGSVAVFGLFTNFNGPTPFAYTWPVIMFGWGLAVMLGIYVAGAISGAHINPAITLSLAATRRFPWSKVLPYIVAQLLGAFVAAAIIYFVYHGALVHAVATQDFGKAVGYVFFTLPKPFVGIFGSFCDEFLGTALLLGLILTIIDARNQPVQGNLNPMIIGFLIVAIGASFGLNTGYAINPARDFGPRLWVFLATGSPYALPGIVNAGLPTANGAYFWIPIVAPILGGIVGAFIYDFTIGKVLTARKLGKSGDTITIGQAVIEPHTDVEVMGRAVREPAPDTGVRGKTVREPAPDIDVSGRTVGSLDE
jgi:glycerol uptake facilitator protein